MPYKSTCKACSHPHSDGVCHQMITQTGNIRLRPWNGSIWGVQGGMVKDNTYNNYGGSTQESITFRPFDIGREENFSYTQESDCGCRFYVPSDNLEFLEWKYDESSK